MKKQPKTKKLVLDVEPTEGVAALAMKIRPPPGYVFKSVDRKGTKATITYTLIEPAQAPNG